MKNERKKKNTYVKNERADCRRQYPDDNTFLRVQLVWRQFGNAAFFTDGVITLRFFLLSFFSFFLCLSVIRIRWLAVLVFRFY